MKLEKRARVLVIGPTIEATFLDHILRDGGYETGVFAYLEEEHLRSVSRLCTYAEEILEMALDFCPHLVVLKYDLGIEEFLTRIAQTFHKDTKPPILVVAGRETWCESADVCLQGPVDPEVLQQTVERLLEQKASR